MLSEGMMRGALASARVRGASLQCRTAGTALLIHPKGALDQRAAAFAAGLAADPEHTMAIVDLPFGALEESADGVARLLRRHGRGSLRVVFGRATPQESRRVAQGLADRIQRPVLAPDGEVLPTAGGGLFVPSHRGAGWLRFTPDGAVERDSRRFPRPSWETSVADHPWRASDNGVIEPIAGGVWVRSRHTHALAEGVRRVVERIPSHPDILTVILGNPEGEAVSLADVRRMWETVLPPVRSWVRFLPIGPVALPAGADTLGQELADALGQQVLLCAGMPVRPRTGLEVPEVASLAPDGSVGARPFLSELMYVPRTGERPVPPVLFGVRAPLGEAARISSGVYRYAADAVVEVVQSGLWMRPLEEPEDGDAVRRVPALLGGSSILYDRSTPRLEERMRSLAEEMWRSLRPDHREYFVVAPADAPPAAAVAVDDAHLWSTADASLFGPHTVAQPADADGGRLCEVAPWSSATPAVHDPAARGVRAAGVLAQARLDPDAEPAGRKGAREAAAPSVRPPSGITRMTAAAPTSPTLPRRESDGGQAGPSGAPVPVVGSVPRSEQDPSADEGRWISAPGDAESTPSAAGVREAHRADGENEKYQRVEAHHDEEGGAGLAPAAEDGGDEQGAVPAEPGAPAAAPPGPASAPTPCAAAPGRRSSAHDNDHAPPSESAAHHGAAQGARPGDDTVAGAQPVSGGATEVPAAPGGPSADGGATGPVTANSPDSERFTSSGAAPAAAVQQETQRVDRPTVAPARVIRLESDSPAGPAVAASAAGGADAPVPVPTTEVRVQPVPTPSACAAVPERGTARERDWVRRTLSTQYDAVAGTVSRVMSQTPGLRGPGREGTDDALTDLVAVHLYLSGDSGTVDAAVRSAVVGPHVPLARCVAAGLRRLPSYRGASLLRAVVTAGQRAWFEESRLVTEWAFCTAYAAPYPGPREGTDFLIWSLTGRRTHLLDPSEPKRLVFTPGTTFRVLRASEGNSPVFMRELLPTEAAGDDQTNERRVRLDEIALNGLERAERALREDSSASEDAETTARRRPGTPPGLMDGPVRRIPGGSDGVVRAHDEGASL
ncbi:hypothetical protein ACIQB4_29865 [Streptomyces griseoluteus]|uniref:hypothetical protein n=1 Tax=Streptomyces griseoluteus TaxID=29306 RepID=UPI0037F5F6D2